MSDSYGNAPHNTRETQYAAGGAHASGPATCARCAAPLAAGAAFCQACGHPVAGAPPARTAAAAPAPASQDRQPAAGLQVSQFVIVTGRARTAGWLVVGGGAALLLSAFLPWVSFLGIVGGHLPAGYFFAFGVVGCVLAYFGVRALKDRVTRAIMTTLWVLAALAALVAIGVFAEGQNLARQSYGTVSPASGFYVGLLGLVATVLGTILLQTTRRSSRQARSAVQISQDGAHWWDGTTWHSVMADAPPNAPRSADGTSWWDGAQWHRVP
jgi:hypothetical protein